MAKRNLTAEYLVLAELTKAGQLDLLQLEQFAWLLEAVLDTNRRVLEWHRTNGDGTRVWCWECQALRGRMHKCQE